MPARSAGGREHLTRALLQQVFHKRAALLEGDNHAHAEQGAPGVFAATAEHFHGDDPFLDAALGRQAQQSALAAVIAVGGASRHRHRGRDPVIDNRASAFVIAFLFCLALEAVPVHAGAQLAAFLVHHPMLVHAPARPLWLNHWRLRAKVDDVAFRRAHWRDSR